MRHIDGWKVVRKEYIKFSYTALSSTETSKLQGKNWKEGKNSKFGQQFNSSVSNTVMSSLVQYCLNATVKIKVLLT